MILCISGMPGSGKTTLAKALAQRYNIECIVQTDVLKAMFVALDIHPELVIPSHQAWREVGDESQLVPIFHKQLDVFNALLSKMIDYFVSRDIPVIFEGVHVGPQLLAHKRVRYFYLSVDEKTRHHRLCTKATGMRIGLWMHAFPHICKLDEHMRLFCRDYLIENVDLEKTLLHIDTIARGSC